MAVSASAARCTHATSPQRGQSNGGEACGRELAQS